MSWNDECEGQDSKWNKLEVGLCCADTKCKQKKSLSRRKTKQVCNSSRKISVHKFFFSSHGLLDGIGSV